MNQLTKVREKIRELDLIALFVESLKTQSSFTMEVEYDPPFAEDYNAWTIHISTSKTNELLFDAGDDDVTCKKGFSFRDIMNKKCEDWDKNQYGCSDCLDYIQSSASKVKKDG